MGKSANTAAQGGGDSRGASSTAILLQKKSGKTTLGGPPATSAISGATAEKGENGLKTASESAGMAVLEAQTTQVGGTSRPGGGGSSEARESGPRPAVDLHPMQSAQKSHTGGAQSMSYKGALKKNFRQVDGEHKGRQAFDLELTVMEEGLPLQELLQIMTEKNAKWYKAGPRGEDLNCIEKTNSGVNPRSAHTGESFQVYKYNSESAQMDTLAKAQKHIQSFTDSEGTYALRHNVTIVIGAFSPSLHAHRVCIERQRQKTYTFEGKLSDQETKQRKITQDGKAWNQVLGKLKPKVTTLLEESGSHCLDFRAVFRNQGQYGLQLGVLVLNTPSEARMVAAAIDGQDYNGVVVRARVEALPVEEQSRTLDMQGEAWPAEVSGISEADKVDLEALRRHLNSALTQDRFKGIFGSQPILRILADHSGVTVLCLQSAEVRQQLAMRLKTVKVPGLSNKRVFFRGPSGAVSEACRAQRRRVRSQSPPEVSSPESGEASPEQAACKPKPLLEPPHCSALQDAANIPAVSVGALSNNVPSEAGAAPFHQILPPHSPAEAIACVSPVTTHNRFDAFEDGEVDMEDEQDEDGGEEDTEVLQVSPVQVVVYGSQETEDEYIALPKGRTPGAKNKRDALTPDQDPNGQADVSKEGTSLCKTQKTLTLSPLEGSSAIKGGPSLHAKSSLSWADDIVVGKEASPPPEGGPD